MRIRPLTFLTLVLTLGGLAVALTWLSSSGGLESLAVFRRAHPLYVGLLLCVTASFVLTRFVRWQFLLRRAQVSIPTRESLRIYLASLLGTATPAYVGEVVRCALLRRRFGAPLSRTVACLLVERLFDVVALSLIGLFRLENPWSQGLMGIFLLAAVVFGLTAAAIAKRTSLPAAVIDGLTRPHNALFTLILSGVVWLPVSLGPSLAARALDFDLHPVDSMQLYSSATLVGAVSLMPAGVGVVGSAQIVQLEKLGMELSSAVAVVTLFRLLTTHVCLLVGAISLVLLLRRSRATLPADESDQFQEYAGQYLAQFRPHVWKLLLERRTGFLAASLAEPSKNGGFGLDLGCGLGLQARALADHGFRVVGVDRSFNMLRHGVELPKATASAMSLPFADGSLDFVCAIGVLHHLPDREAQDAACREVQRVLRKDGLFVVQETNTRNPLFRLYMGYVFPVLSHVDDGTEHWLEPTRWRTVSGLALSETRYFTFLPDFIPRWLMPPFLSLERWLERSSMRPYSVHYQVVLRKT